VILFARNYAEPAQLRALTASIRAVRDPALLIGVDHEGGRVQRFREGFTAIPAMRTLGALWDRDLPGAAQAARGLGATLATELERTASTSASRRCSISTSAAAPSSAIVRCIATRTRWRILPPRWSRACTPPEWPPSASTFPATATQRADSHVELPIDDRPLAALVAADLVPFGALIAAKLDAVMPAHVVYPAVDAQPAGFSSIWLREILRGRLGFGGMVFSDDLCMAGALAAGDIVARADAACAAGCDMVLICNDPIAAATALDGWRPQVPAELAARAGGDGGALAVSRDDAPQFASEVAPLVSCLMVSRGDVFPAHHAIACFLRQTHANRELVIVINGPGSTLVAAVAELGDARIRVIELAPAPRTLGELRNIAVANARGEYVCSWDDDDLHAPERIAVQLNALLTHAAAGCVLSRLTLWWPAAERLATSGKRAWEGSILALKRALPEYPPLSRGEDTEMLDEFIRHAHVVSLEAPELYVYVRHGSNTVGATHFARIYNYSLRRWVNAEYRQRLEALAESLPVREYAAELPAEDLATFQRDADVPRPTPLVSIVVRSMGRPELHRALQSLVAQDYPALDIVVVDATGGKHPPLPNLALREGHSVRMVGGRERLLRPHAANVGLAALRGEWFGFLDDDDTFDAKHVSDLIHASATHPEALVVYGTSRSLNADNEVIGLFGLGFNRWVMQFGPILLWPAALIRRTVIDRGCRFDERLEICEDRDFLAQIAALGDFAFVPCVNFNYRPDLGTSGTGRGANRDDVRRTCYDELLRAKWIGSGVYHTQRAMRLGQRAREAHARGDAAEARSWLRRTLQLYPDDPNALNGLGYLCLEAGELDEAETLLLRALEVHPVAGDYRINLAKVLERSGRRHAARRQALAAVADPSTRASATLLLTQLGEMPPRIGNRHRTGAPSNPSARAQRRVLAAAANATRSAAAGWARSHRPPTPPTASRTAQLRHIARATLRSRWKRSPISHPRR
jgi:beta-N-acetylhexosaminidase